MKKFEDFIYSHIDMFVAIAMIAFFLLTIVLIISLIVLIITATISLI